MLWWLECFQAYLPKNGNICKYRDPTTIDFTFAGESDGLVGASYRTNCRWRVTSMCRSLPCKQKIENFLIVIVSMNGMAKSGFVIAPENGWRKLHRQRGGRQKDREECNCLARDVPVYLIQEIQKDSGSFSYSDSTVLTLSGRMIHLIGGMVSWSWIYGPWRYLDTS